MTHPGPTCRSVRWSAIAAGILLSVGCSTFSATGGFDAVEGIARDRLGKDLKRQRNDQDRAAIHASVKKLLVSPLPAEDAVQIALLNNPGLQATYADLGVAEADLVQAGRMMNPHLSYLRTSHGGERKLEWSLTFPVVDLLTMPLRMRLESRRFEQVKLAVAQEMLRVAAETRNAWIDTVAAGDRIRALERIRLAAEASADLAVRMEEAGNISRMARMQAQLSLAETDAQLARARQEAGEDRERLVRLMGLERDPSSWALPDRLAELPDAVREIPDVEQRALDERLDIRAAKLEAEGVAASLGLTRATRFVNVLELGPAFSKEDPEPWKRGFEASLQLPLFDWGQARVARAESIYLQSLHRVAERALKARSEARRSYSAYRAAYETAKLHRDGIVPLRRRISEEMLLRYNGMLVGPLELLEDARGLASAEIEQGEALRAFWRAESDLQAAFNGAPDSGR